MLHALDIHPMPFAAIWLVVAIPSGKSQYPHGDGAVFYQSIAQLNGYQILFINTFHRQRCI
jgi:hypothetical protein